MRSVGKRLPRSREVNVPKLLFFDATWPALQSPPKRYIRPCGGRLSSRVALTFIARHRLAQGGVQREAHASRLLSGIVLARLRPITGVGRRGERVARDVEPGSMPTAGLPRCKHPTLSNQRVQHLYKLHT